MRLPQSRNTSLFLYVVFIFLLTIAAASHAQTQTQQLVCSSSELRFGAVVVGQSEAQLVTLTNTGTSGVTVSSVGSNDAGFTVFGLTLPATIAAGQSADLNVIFAPAQTGWTGGLLTFVSSASNSKLQLQVGGSGVTSEAVTAEPASLSFGQVAVGKTATQSIQLTNATSRKVTISAIQDSASAFTLNGLQIPAVLSPGQSVTLNVAFSPQAAGEIGGSALLIGPALDIPFSGTGTVTTVGQLSLSPASLNFGNVDDGTSSTQSLNLSAVGGSVTISSATSSSGQYSISNSLPLTISSGQSVALNVVFSPTAAGTTSSTLTFASNASNGQTTESVTGVGLPPSVSLSWAASNSSVIGYNVYRGVTNGSYSKVNTAVDPNTSYTDTSVSTGVTYYYVATAINSSGEESAYSSPPLKVSVP